MNEANFQIIILDWFFTLGFNKVPLNIQSEYLKALVKHGWFFFYKFLIKYF